MKLNSKYALWSVYSIPFICWTHNCDGQNIYVPCIILNTVTHGHLKLTVKDPACLFELKPQEYVTHALPGSHMPLLLRNPVQLPDIWDVNGTGERHLQTKVLHQYQNTLDSYCKKLPCLPDLKQFPKSLSEKLGITL